MTRFHLAPTLQSPELPRRWLFSILNGAAPSWTFVYGLTSWTPVRGLTRVLAVTFSPAGAQMEGVGTRTGEMILSEIESKEQHWQQHQRKCVLEKYNQPLTALGRHRAHAPPHFRARCPQLWAVRGPHARAASQAAASGDGALGGAAAQSGWPFLPSAAPSDGRPWLRAPWAALPGLCVSGGGDGSLGSPTPSPASSPVPLPAVGYGWWAATGHAPLTSLWSHWVGTWKETLGADSVSRAAFLMEFSDTAGRESLQKKCHSQTQ